MQTKPNRVTYTLEQIRALYADRGFDEETLLEVTNGINDPATIPAIALGGFAGCYTAPVVRVMGTALDWADLLAKAYLDECPHTKAVLVFTRRPRAHVDDPRIILIYAGAGNHYCPQHARVDMASSKNDERRMRIFAYSHKSTVHCWLSKIGRPRCRVCNKALYSSSQEAEKDALQFHANRPHGVYSCAASRDDCPNPNRWLITTNKYTV